MCLKNLKSDLRSHRIYARYFFTLFFFSLMADLLTCFISSREMISNLTPEVGNDNL